jgi:hypothetical protein
MRTIAPTISDIVNYNTMSQRKLFFAFSFVPARDPRSMCQGQALVSSSHAQTSRPAGSRFYVDYANGKDDGCGAAAIRFCWLRLLCVEPSSQTYEVVGRLLLSIVNSTHPGVTTTEARSNRQGFQGVVHGMDLCVWQCGRIPREKGRPSSNSTARLDKGIRRPEA